MAVLDTGIDATHPDLVDRAGLREGNDNLPPGDQAWWESYRSRLERVAQESRSA